MIRVAVLASALAVTLCPASVGARLQHRDPFHDDDDDDERPIGDPDEDDEGNVEEDDEDDEEEPWQVRGQARGSPREPRP